MPFVGAGLGGHADHAASAVTLLGIHAILGNRDFLNGVHIRRKAVFVTQADGAAVHLEVVFQVGAAAQIHAIGGPGQEGEHLASRIDRLRRQQSQLERIAIETRRFRSHGGIQGKVLVGRVKLYFHGRRHYRDGLLHRAWCQDGVDGNVGTHFHHDIFLNELAEAGRLDGHRICAGIDQIKHVQASVTGLPDHLDSRLDVQKRHRRASNRTFACVTDQALDAPFFLREGGNCEQNKHTRYSPRGGERPLFHTFDPFQVITKKPASLRLMLRSQSDARPPSSISPDATNYTALGASPPELAQSSSRLCDRLYARNILANEVNCQCLLGACT